MTMGVMEGWDLVPTAQVQRLRELATAAKEFSEALDAIAHPKPGEDLRLDRSTRFTQANARLLELIKALPEEDFLGD